MLKRNISTLNVLIIAAGGTIGSGWLLTPLLGAKIAGPNALISWVIAAIFMLLIALPLCELGAMLPISGGMSTYPTFTHGKEVGFLFSWITWLSYVVMTPIEIQAILQYSSHFFPHLLIKQSPYFKLSLIGYLTALVIMLVVVIINTYGSKFLSECTKFASIIKFILPSTAILALIHASPSFENIHFTLTTEQNWMQIFSALSTGGIAFAFAGFQNGLMLAGEVKNPQKIIPITMLGAVLLIFLLYFCLQLAFLIAIPAKYLQHGWQHLVFPGDNAPLVGVTLLLGLTWVAAVLLFDAAISPLGTALVYTAATSRILYGMALNEYLPTIFLKMNKHQIPYITLYANFFAGALAFLPFPNWQKMVAFLSSASIFSYTVGPISLLALRKLRAEQHRPFRLNKRFIFCYASFFVCNIMLYWCGFDIIWKLYVAIMVGFAIYAVHYSKLPFLNKPGLYWFFSYLSLFLLLSYLSPFGGWGLVKFPFDLLLLFAFSACMLYLSQRCLVTQEGKQESFKRLRDQLKNL